ncbi:MAG: hypothetical protein JWR65_2643 [Massilia sp.]|jgi:hypothetical protein|nr:hypothetical protein [Massilia sp.]
MKKHLSKLALGSVRVEHGVCGGTGNVGAIRPGDGFGNGRPYSASFSTAVVAQHYELNHFPTQGNTSNVSISPTVGVNVSVFGSGTQNVGSSTYQSGGTQTATNR